MSRLFCVFATVALLACGPSSKGNGGDDTKVDAAGSGDQPDAYSGPIGTVTGRVWMPNYGPGQVPAGQEIPVFGALVSLTTTKLAPIPDHAYCEQCSQTPGATSGHDGSFTLTAPPGTYWLTIQKGQFRLEEQVIVSEGALDLPPATTTLPSQYDPTHGAWIPKVAVAVGNYDAVEDILGKIGFGTMDGSDQDLTSGAGEHGSEIDLYTYGTGATSVSSLIGDINKLRKYHIIFFPCSTEMAALDSYLAIQTNLKVLRQYVNEGGKIYVTDWSGEFADRPFPPQITLGDSGNDSAGTYDPKTLDGTLTSQGTSDGDPYDSSDAQVNDPDLSAWLGGQMAPDAAGTVSMIDPNNFSVVDNWNRVTSLTQVQVGTDTQGLPVYDVPKAWISGSDGTNPGKHPLSVTYQPTGCGRVLYSTYQTSGASASDKHAGLTAQERVLLYLIMEIQVCNSIVVN